MKFVDQSEQAEFNQGVSIVIRLDAYWKDLAQAYHNDAHGDFKRVFTNLKLVFKELWPVMNDDEREEHLSLLKKVTKAFFDARKNLVDKGKSSVTELMSVFDEWELELRDTQQAHDMGMPQKKDPRFSMK